MPDAGIYKKQAAVDSHGMVRTAERLSDDPRDRVKARNSRAVAVSRVERLDRPGGRTWRVRTRTAHAAGGGRSQRMELRPCPCTRCTRTPGKLNAARAGGDRRFVAPEPGTARGPGSGNARKTAAHESACVAPVTDTRDRRPPPGTFGAGRLSRVDLMERFETHPLWATGTKSPEPGNRFGALSSLGAGGSEFRLALRLTATD